MSCVPLPLEHWLQVGPRAFEDRRRAAGARPSCAGRSADSNRGSGASARIGERRRARSAASRTGTEADAMARMKGPDRVRAALDAASLDCPIRTLPDSTRTAVEAAAAVGCSVGEIAKSLVFRAGDRAVVAIMSGDNRLDPARLARRGGRESRSRRRGLRAGGHRIRHRRCPAPRARHAGRRLHGHPTCSGSTRSGLPPAVRTACSRSSRRGCGEASGATVMELKAS